MSLVQRDFILRLIEAVAAALARALRRRESGDFAGARRELHMACSELLGPMTALAECLDARTAADLVGDTRRTALWARLLASDAELLRLMDRHADADVADRRALELILEVSLRETVVDEGTRELVELLRQRVAVDSLSPRHSGAMATLTLSVARG
jgi:hypothetical protein